MASGTRLGSMYWETGVDNAGLQRGLDQSEQAVQQFGSRASGAFSALTVAAGTLLASGIEKLASGIMSIGKNAISSTADMQMMQVGLEGLLAKEIARGDEATRTYQTTSSLNAGEQQQVHDLTLKLDQMNAKLQEKKQHLWEIQNVWTDEGLAAQSAAADIAVYENNIGKTVAQLEALKAKQGQVNTVTEKYWINTTSISEAMPQAQERAKALMDELARISILSPYEVEAVQSTFKLAMAFGYTADQATVYTKAILNVAAGTGASNETLQRMAYNFAQIRMQGRVTAVDIRQLAMAGFDLTSVLQSVGQQFGVNIKTHEDFNAAIANGSITWEQFTTGFAKYADDNFGGASERMSRTLNGLKSTFSDLFKLTLPKIVGPALEEVTGLLSDFLDGLLKIRETGILDDLGAKLGAFTSKAVAGIRGLAKLPGVVKELVELDPHNIAELNDILSALPDSLQGLARAGADLIKAFQDGGIGGVLSELYGMFAQWWKREGQQWLSDTAGAIWEWVQKIPGEVGGKVSGWVSGAWETLRNVWEAIYKWWETGGADWLSDTVGVVWDYITKIPGEIGKKVSGLVEDAKKWLADVWNALHLWWDTGGSEWVTTTAGKVWEWVQEIPGTLGGLITGAAMDVGSWLADVWLALGDWWDTGGEEWVSTTAGKISAWVSTLLTSENVPDVIKDAIDWLEPIWMSTATWWDDKAEPLTKEILDGFGRWMDKEMVPALKNSDKTTWANGVGEALSSGFEQAIDYLYTPEVSARIANAIMHWYVKSFFDAVGLLAEIPIGIVQALINLIFDDTREPVDLGPGVNWVLKTLEGAFQGAIDGFKESRAGQMLIQFVTFIIDSLKAGFGIGGGEGGGTKTAMIAEVGTGLVDGLWDGISSKAVELTTNIQTFVTTNIKGAVVWTTALVEAGHDIIAGLIKGLEEKKDDVIGWVERLVGGIVAAIKKMFGIESPSRVMAEIGRLIVAGLIKGLEGSTPEAVAAMTDTMGAVMGAVNSIVGALSGLANMGNVAGAVFKLIDVIKQIKAIIPVLAELAGFYAGAEAAGQLRGSKAVVDALVDVFAGLRTVAEAVASVAAAGVTVSQLSLAKGVIDGLADLIRDLVRNLSDIGAAFSANDLLDALMLATAAGPVIEAFAMAAELVNGLVRVSTANIANKATALVEAIGTLIKKITWLANSIPADVLAAASAASGLIVEALAPWQAMIVAYNAFADFVLRSDIGPKSKALAIVIERLILKITWLANSIGEDTLENSARVAGMIVDALSPWREMVSTYTALADFVLSSGIGEKAKALTTVIERLILKITWLANSIGDTTLENSARVAGLIVEALAPWKAMVETVDAVGSFNQIEGIGEKARLLADAVEVLALALARMADRMGFDVLEKAKKVGRLLSDVLAPWEAAIKLSDEMRAWQIMPDLEDRFTRFARQWVNIVADLSEAVSVLDDDGLAAVAAFGVALEALMGGLQEALVLAINMPANWSEPPNWDAFMRWVQDVFMVFYSWINGWGGSDTRPPIPSFDEGGLDMVGLFGDVLGALMGGLQAALDLALALPAEWTQPPSWDAFVTWVQAAFLTFYYWINSWGGGDTRPPIPSFDGEALDMVGLFGDALGALMGGLQAALDLALALPAEWTEPPSWDAFATWVQGAFLLFNTWVTANFPTPEDPEAPDQFGAITGFGGALGALMGGLSAALDLALALPAEWSVPTEAWDNFVTWVTGVFGQFMTWVTANFPTPEDPEAPDQFGAITGFGDALGALMDGLSAALDLALALPATWTAPTAEMWDAFFGWVTDVFDAFMTYVQDNYPTDPESASQFEPIQAFGDAMGAVFDGLVAALELFVNLANWAGPSSTFNTRLHNFLEAVSGAISYIAAFILTDPNLNPDNLVSVAAFGEALSSLVGGLSDALDLFATLADTDPSVYTESTLFEDRVGNLLQSISGTLSAFQTWILGPQGSVEWQAAAGTFYTAIETVFGVLSDALDFFIDLETSGMPPTPQIQAFVTAIADLFDTVAVQLGGLAQPGGALTLAIAAVESVIVGFPATMDTHQQAWWDAAGALAVKIPQALAASVGTTTTVNSLRWGIDQIMHEIVSFSGWWVPVVAVPAWYQAGIDFATALVNGMLSLTGENGAIYNAGYALAQSGMDGFNAGAGLAAALANTMPDNMAHGWTMDTTQTLNINLVGVGSPTGHDLSYAAVDQITDMLRDKIRRGG